MVEEKQKEGANTEEKAAESKQGGMNIKMLAVTVLLGLLIVFSAVQAVELAGLKEQIHTELDGLSVASGGTANVSSSGTLQENLQNLPNMVGGC